MASVRAAGDADLEEVARIYNEGIEDRRATFETDPRATGDLEPWLADAPGLPFLVAEEAGAVVGFAKVARYSDREAYAGVGEAMTYVGRAARGSGVGPMLLEALCAEAEMRGFHKLIGRLFPENETSLRLIGRCGFWEVGLHLRHGRLEGEWRDVLVVERLLGLAAR